MSKSGFYITTAIVYPNSRMHVGFGWEVMGSDMIARFQHMQGRDVFFATGVDEHSQNVEKAAIAAGKTAKAYCDQMSEDIIKVMDQMEIAYDRFIRTSDSDHEAVCRKLIEQAFKDGDIYKQKYEGLYCDSCEVFYTEKEVADKVCPTHKQPLRVLAEENYFFKLSKYENALKDLFKKNPQFLEPAGRKNEVVSFLENGLKDFSVSRTSFKWGVSLPWDTEHVIYVWYDALINYLSAVKMFEDPKLFQKFWPADVHVIGKDITRFHCLYWPAMLMSSKIELPKKVWAHGFIELNGEKMSKTRGNIVTPDAVIKDFGVTALRWYLLSGVRFDGDGQYSDEALVTKCNADLSNNIGNLVNRSVNMCLKYFPNSNLTHKAKLPTGVQSISERYSQILGSEAQKLKTSIDTFALSEYCQLIIDFAMSMNKFIDETKPWALAKAAAAGDASQNDILETVLFELLEGIRCLGVMIWPVIPQASDGILNQLGFENAFHKKVKLYSQKEMNVPQFQNAIFNTKTKFNLKAPQPLFPRLELNKEKTN